MSGTKGLIFIKVEGLAEALQFLDTPAVRKAAKETLKDLVKMAKTEASSGIREKFNLKKQDLDPRLKVRLPSFSNLTSEIAITGTPIPLVYFGAREVRDTQQGVLVQDRRSGRIQRRASGARGVTYEVERGQRKTLSKAFMAYHSRFDRVEVFQRKGKKRLPLRTFRSITIPSMFSQDRVILPVTAKVQDNFDQRFDHHLRYFVEVAES